MENLISGKKEIKNLSGDRLETDYIKIAPSTSASVTVSGSGNTTTFNVPNKAIYSGRFGLKVNFSATSTAGSVNAIITLTQSSALSTGTFVLVWQDPFTGKTGTTTPIAYNAAVGTVATALEALSAFRGTVTVTGTLAAATTSTFTFSGAYAGMPIPATSLYLVSSNGETSDSSVSTAGNGVCVGGSALYLLNRLRLTSGSTEIASLNLANIRMAGLVNMTWSKEKRILEGPEFGLNWKDVQYTEAANGTDYFIPLYKFMDLFEHKGISLPAMPLQLEITWEEPTTALYTEGSTAGLSYTVSSMEIQYYTITNKVPTSVNELAFSRVYSNKTTVSSNSTSFTAKIDFPAKSCRSYMGLLLTTADLTDASVYNKLENYHHSSITNYQFNINGTEYPTKTITCNNGAREALAHLMRGLKPGEYPMFRTEQYNSTISDESEYEYEPGWCQGDKFIIYYPFYPPYSDTGEHVHKYVNGGAQLNVTGTNNLVVNKDAVATDYTFISFIEVDAILAASNTDVKVIM